MDLSNPTTQRNLVLVALVATVVVLAAVVISAHYRIHNTGTVKAIGVDVFWDANCTVPVENIDWELIAPGELKGTTVYIKNSKNVNFTMSINASSWVPPEAEQYFTLDWNYTGEVLYPTDVVVTQISLYLDPNVAEIETFSFDIIIWADEYQEG